jgi:dUTP pyrophosphatase
MLSTIQVKCLDQKLKNYAAPCYATQGSAGLDLLACIDGPLTIQPNAVHLISTGMAIYIKDPAYAGVILPRSGLGHKHGLVLGNQAGLIDADYQGPLMVSLLNRSEQAYEIQPGDRIAQLIIIPVSRPVMQWVDDFESTDRGQAGFGSTGVKTKAEASND